MALRVLVVERDSAVRRQLRGQIESLGGIQVVGEGADAGGVANLKSLRADAAFIGIPEGAGSEAALEALARLPLQFPGISIVATGRGESMDLVLQALRAGAVEFLRHPIAKADVTAAIEKVKSLRPIGPANPREPGHVTAVYSAKGGLGVTTLATNLAVCLSQRAGESVLVDLDLVQGGVATFLNLQPTYSVVDVFGHTDRLDEPFLRGLLLRHPSGLLVLPAPSSASRFDFAAEEVVKGLQVVQGVFTHVVLDLPHDLEPGTVAALEHADEILYVVGLNVPALRASVTGLTALQHLGIDQRKVRVIVARANAHEEVNIKGVRDALGIPVFWRTPNDYPTVVASLNEGQPLVLSAPRSEIARNMRELVDRLSRNGVGKDDAKGWFPSIFRRALTQSA